MTTPLQTLGFELDNGIYKHKRAPIRAVETHGGAGVRLIYNIGDDFLSSLTVDVKNTEHEIRMGLVDFKNVLTKLGAIQG